MCGISGCIVRNNAEYATDVYSKLVRESDIRGQDGTGITIQHNENFYTYRWDDRAKKLPFFENNSLLKLHVGDKIIGQNRYAIFGLGHENDQPIIGHDFSIVHNGVLYDYKKQFEYLFLKRELKVDTELILRLCEEYIGPHDPENGVRNVINLFDGEAACLMLTKLPLNPFIAFMKNKILYTGDDKFGNNYFYSTPYIGKKISEICVNNRAFEENEVIIIY